MGDKVYVRFLGGFSIQDEGGRSLLPGSRKARGIVAYCLYKAGEDIARDTLAEVFWPDRPREQGLASLRQAFREIRIAFGDYADAIMQINRHDVKVNPGSFENEIDDVLDHKPLPENHRLMQGLENASSEFEAWLLNEQRNFKQSVLNRSEKRLTELAVETDQALAEALRILTLEPENEAAARIAMQHYAARGEFGRAVTVFRHVQEALKSLDLRVSQETSAQFETLRELEAGRTLPQPSRPAAARSGPPTVALVAFDHPLQDIAWLAQFDHLLRVELSARMAEIREFRFLSLWGGAEGSRRAESMAFNRAHEAGADYMIFGSILATGVDQQAEAIIQVARTETGEILRTLRSTPSASDIPTAAHDIVEHIASTLPTIVEQADWSKILTGDPAEWSAYQCYLQAKKLIVASVDTDYMDEAEPLLERAIALDPSYSPPYSYLAGSYNSGRKITSPGTDRLAGNKRAIQVCQKYLIHDAQSPNAHLSMAWCLLRMGRFAEVQDWLEKAIKLRPYDPNRINAIGTAFVYLGDPKRGIAFYDLAKRRLLHNLDFIATDYGEAYYFLGDYERAIDYLMVDELRNPARTYLLRCATLGQLGRLVEAQDAAEIGIGLLRARWRGGAPFSSQAAVKWYVDGFPLQDRTHYERLVLGLAKAGLVL